MDTKKLKVALVHDLLNQYGGAERVLEVLAEMFPEAPIYTLLYDKKKMHGRFSGREIHTSYLQKFPSFLRRHPKWLLPLFPTAPETFDLREFDLVISSSGAWAKGIVTRLDTLHIAYIHSPMRFIWDYNEKYLKEDRHGKLGFFIRPFLSYLRLWDKLSADRPDYLIANSNYTQARIAKYYRRESTVIYPPVGKTQITRYNRQTNSKLQVKNLKENAKYFLIVSRLSPYKKIDRAIEAFNKLELPLVVVGTGKQEKELKMMAKDNVKFLGWVPDEKMSEIYESARAFIFPSVDDFGIAPAEAQMRGIPVIAVRQGGAKEIAEEGKTGEFFDSATPEVIADAVRRFVEKEENYDREYIKQSSEKFSKERFKKEMKEYINDAISKSKYQMSNQIPASTRRDDRSPASTRINISSNRGESTRGRQSSDD
jgi:glycosyltransferase involved in cell wall biosynthesis